MIEIGFQSLGAGRGLRSGDFLKFGVPFKGEVVIGMFRVGFAAEGFPKLGLPFGVPIMRIIVFLGSVLGSPYLNYQVFGKCMSCLRGSCDLQGVCYS